MAPPQNPTNPPPRNLLSSAPSIENPINQAAAATRRRRRRREGSSSFEQAIDRDGRGLGYDGPRIDGIGNERGDNIRRGGGGFR